jgi:hypothetical protein
MISELQALKMIDNPTPEERRRIRRLEIKQTTKPNVKVIWPERKATPPISEQLDLVREKFGKEIEPWSVFECSVCKESYHLVDKARCECGKEESEKRFKKYLGEMKI